MLLARAIAAAGAASVLVASAPALADRPAPPPAPARAERAEPAGPEPTHQFVWFDGEVGVETAHLETFQANADSLTAGIVPTDGTGPAFGLGVGVRLLFLTLGARARGAQFESSAVGAWQLWSLDGEVGIRVPLRRFEPHFTLGAGYTTTGGFANAVQGLSNGIDVNGANIRGGVGLDYFLTRALTVGGQLTGDVLMLSRPPVSVHDLLTAQQVGTLNEAKARVLQANGASVGTAVAFTGGLGLHF